MGLAPFFLYGPDTFRQQYPNVKSAPEKYRGVVFKVGQALLEVADGHIAVKTTVFKELITNSKVSLLIDVQSVDEIVEKCGAMNYPIAVEPKKYPWGTREVVLKDPDGVVVVFRENLSNSTEQD